MVHHVTDEGSFLAIICIINTFTKNCCFPLSDWLMILNKRSEFLFYLMKHYEKLTGRRMTYHFGERYAYT